MKDDFRYLWLTLFFLYFFMIWSGIVRAQTQPSISGWHWQGWCLVDGVPYPGEFFSGHGTTCVEAQNDAGAAGRPCHNSGCQPAAICLGGGGYYAADAAGFCPDPDHEDGDDDDGDGSDCDAGEEDTPDCNDGDDDDVDSDGDGEPDSSDPDDGICLTAECPRCEWLGEGDSDPDCDGANCEAGERQYFGNTTGQGLDFPDTICEEGCLWRYLGYGAATAETAVGEFENTGESCTGEEDECPEGEQLVSTDPVQCEPIENFCEEDLVNNETGYEDPDGIPDNIDTFACRQQAEEECDPLNETCERSSASFYACELESPPDCDEAVDPVGCAQLALDYQTTCGVEFTAVFECDLEFLCTGNPIECARLNLEQKAYCDRTLTEEQAEDERSLEYFQEGIDDGADYQGGEDVEGSEVDISDLLSQFDYSGFGLSSSCPNDKTVTILGKSVEFPFSVWCPLFALGGVLVLLISTIISVYIVLESF